MRLKRFNQLNEGKYDDFIEEVEKYINTDYEEGEEPTNVDMLSEVGELMNKYNLNRKDLRTIVDENPDNWEIQHYVKPQLDYEDEKESRDNQTFKDIDAILVNHNLVGSVKSMNGAIVDIIKYFNDNR